VHNYYVSTTESTERRMTIARALARQILERRGEHVMPDAVERDATKIAAGLYVESLGDDLTLCERSACELAHPGPR
jgi:hypothetical protein